MKLDIEKAIDRIVTLLNDPNEFWVFDGHTINNSKHGLEIWPDLMAVIFGNTLWQPRVQLAVCQKFRLWWACRTATHNMNVRALQKFTSDE